MIGCPEHVVLLGVGDVDQLAVDDDWAYLAVQLEDPIKGETTTRVTRRALDTGAPSGVYSFPAGTSIRPWRGKLVVTDRESIRVFDPATGTSQLVAKTFAWGWSVEPNEDGVAWFESAVFPVPYRLQFRGWDDPASVTILPKLNAGAVVTSLGHELLVWSEGTTRTFSTAKRKLGAATKIAKTDKQSLAKISCSDDYCALGSWPCKTDHVGQPCGSDGTVSWWKRGTNATATVIARDTGPEWVHTMTAPLNVVWFDRLEGVRATSIKTGKTRPLALHVCESAASEHAVLYTAAKTDGGPCEVLAVVALP